MTTARRPTAYTEVPKKKHRFALAAEIPAVFPRRFKVVPFAPVLPLNSHPSVRSAQPCGSFDLP